MIKKNKVPEKTHLEGLRMMEEKDVKEVTALLKQYLLRFDLAPVYSEEEVHHWFLHKGDEESRVVWAYVVEVNSPKRPSY
jgi:glycylpeptide N-tetradecanoyltransferase